MEVDDEREEGGRKMKRSGCDDEKMVRKAGGLA
jgi:hypothetical protein